MATRHWLGAAASISQVTTITIGGTWATSDTLTITSGNGNDLVATVGALTATTDVAALLAAAFNATSATDSLVGDESRNLGGQQIAEFTDIVASAENSTVVLTAQTAGLPFTVSVSKSSASGTISASETTSATGANFADNADNWSGNTLPVDGDEIVFDAGNVDVLFGLDLSAVTPTAIVRTMNYTGRIGLPATNEIDPSNPYPEYRPRYLQLGNAADATNTAVTIGGGDGAGGGRMNLDSGDGQVTMNVYNTGPAENEHAVVWKGTHASNEINVHRGELAIAPGESETAAVATLRVGYIENQTGDASVQCGAGVSLTNVVQTGGSSTIRGNTTSLQISAGVAELIAGAHALIELLGGEVIYRSTGAITNANIASGGRLDFSRDGRSRTVANCQLNSRGELHDPFRTVTFTNGVDLYRTHLGDTTLDLGTHVTLEVSDI